MLPLIAHVLPLTSHCSLLIAHVLASLTSTQPHPQNYTSTHPHKCTTTKLPIWERVGTLTFLDHKIIGELHPSHVQLHALTHWQLRQTSTSAPELLARLFVDQGLMDLEQGFTKCIRDVHISNPLGMATMFLPSSMPYDMSDGF